MTTSDISLTVSIVTGAIITIMTPVLAYLSKRNGEKADALKVVTEQNKVTTDGKLVEIHGLVNSSLTAAQQHIAALIAENQTQKETITRLTPPPDSVVILTQKVTALEAELARQKALLHPGH